MNIVIVGAGKVGYTLAEQLSKEGHDITVIDKWGAKLAEMSNALDVITLEGNGASYTVQSAAGVDHANILIAVTNADEVNLLCCLVAKKLGVKHTMARVRDPEYFKQMLILKEELGLSMVINPEQAAAKEISRILRFPSAIKVDTFAKGRVEMVELKVRENSPLDGLLLSHFSRYFHTKLLICAVERGEEVFIPKGDFVLQTGDRVTIAGSPQDIHSFFRDSGSFKKPVKDVMIMGGGKIAYYLAKELSEMGIRVKVIEMSLERCNDLCEYLPKASIICGDGTDQELLHEEGIHSTDAFVALTGFDEENIIISMYANACKVGKVITKISKPTYMGMLENSGLESFILPKQITANQIIRYVRAMENSAGSSVETLYRLVDNRVEALEFVVRAGAKCIGIPLKELRLRPDVLIAAIIRKGQCITPGGGDTIEERDSVIVVTSVQGLRDLNAIMLEG